MTHIGSIGDRASGATVLVVGVAVVAYTLTNLNPGTITSPGSGAFPLLIGVCLCLFGGSIFLTGALAKLRKKETRESDAAPVLLESLIYVNLAVAAFALMIEHFGLVPATFVQICIAAAATKSLNAKKVILFGIAVSVMAAIVFKIGLKTPVPLIAWP